MSSVNSRVDHRIRDCLFSGQINAVRAGTGMGDMHQASPIRYEVLKPILDGALALLLLLLLAPVTLTAALLVRLTSRGPAFYTQTRLGWHGRSFTIYKLRTMYHRCEASTGAVWSAPGDPRVTPVGRLLRATHIDEFPQIVNVLLGHMSLIGPRPERPEITAVLQENLDRYTARLLVRPGISGLAQVQLPPDVDRNGVRKKLICDLFYIAHLSVGLDLRLLLCTGLFMLGIPLPSARRWLKIPEPLGPAADLMLPWEGLSLD